MNIINIKMNAEEIIRLVERYYRGESSEEEESTLREYFKGNNIPEGFDVEKVIFGYYDTVGEVPEPSIDFEARIIKGIDNIENRKGSLDIKRFLLPLISAAAGLLLLAGSYFFIIHRGGTGDTFKDPEIAYAETMKILMYVSSKLNHGTQTLEPIGKIDELSVKSFKVINESTTLVEKSLRSLAYLQNAIEITNIPNSRDK
jgi:hypothetical protein